MYTPVYTVCTTIVNITVISVNVIYIMFVYSDHNVTKITILTIHLLIE